MARTPRKPSATLATPPGLKTVSTIVEELSDNDRVRLGDNMPPEPVDPFVGYDAHVADLYETAKGFLDGEGVTTEAMAQDVQKLIDEARQVQKDSDDARAAEKKPHADAATAVDDKWRPISHAKTGKCALIIETAKKALTPWLQKLANEQRQREEEARERAAELQREADKARRAAQESTDLEARERAEELAKDAERASRDAKRAGNERATVKSEGTSRAVGLVKRYNAVGFIDDNAAPTLAYYRERNREGLRAWLLDEAQKDVRAGARSIPGVIIEETEGAR